MHIKHEIVGILEGASPAPSLNIVTNPKIRAYLDDNYREALQRLKNRYGVEIRISISDTFHVENYAIERLSPDGERVTLPAGIEAEQTG
jgi:Ribonuclease G/E